MRRTRSSGMARLAGKRMVPLPARYGVSSAPRVFTTSSLAGNRLEELLRDHGLALQMGRLARAVARERFSIERFAQDWTSAFEDAIGRSTTTVRSHPVWNSSRNGSPTFVPAGPSQTAFTGDTR